MADRDILARMDGHMERGNEHMARGNQLMAEVRHEMRLTREFMAEHAGVAAGQLAELRGALADTRIFAQQQMARLDRMLRDNARTMDAQVDELRRTNDRLERRDDEQREESRAGREALLAILDRLNRLDPPGAPS